MTKATIHHTAFALSPVQYGKRVVMLDIAATANISEVGEAAFMLSNHPDQAQFAKQIVSSTGRCYSMSVGDLIEHEGRYAMVAGTGFTPITEDEVTRLLARWERQIEWDDEARAAAATLGVGPLTVHRWEMGFHGNRYLNAIRKLVAPTLETSTQA